MSDPNDSSEVGATQPVAQHGWLAHLLGEWEVTTEMTVVADQPPQIGTGRESVRSMGGLWARTEGTGTMPDGTSFGYTFALGYDVTFKRYRGCWFADVSSHLWVYNGELSEDGRIMTLTCEGPDMTAQEGMCLYRDVHELVDSETRLMRSYAQTPEGDWVQFSTSTLRRLR